MLFRALIGIVHNIAFLGVFAIDYDASVFTPPGSWGAFIILVPVVGGLIVTFLITNFAPEASEIAGIISKEHIADSVAESIKPFA